MTSLQNKWAKPATVSIGERIGDTIKPKGPLKPRIQVAIANMQKQIAKLDAMLARMKARDARLFEQIVTLTQAHDTGKAKVLSNELAEIRKVTNVLGNARMALEQINLRLTTAHDLGDTVVAIMPTIGLMRSLKVQLAKFMPGADREIAAMAEMLSGIMADTLTGDSALGMNTETTEESESILKEAAAVAEASVDSKFPTTPTDVGTEAHNAGDPKYL